MNKAQLISVTGEVFEVTPKNGNYFELWEMQTFLGGHIELVVCPDGREMYVNEEGKLMGLWVNKKATEISGLYPHDVICGHVLIGAPEIFRDAKEVGM